jgi:hypothetical protein
MAIQVLTNRSLVRYQEDFADLRVTAAIEIESGEIKRIGDGAILRVVDNAASQIANFSKQEVGSLTINIDRDVIANLAEICSALPAFIQSVQTSITAA